MGRGLMVLSLQKKVVATRMRKRVWTVKETDLVLFARQLATMIDAGISLIQSLTALYEQCDPRRQKSLRHVISDVTSRIEGGETFHEAISKHPRVFSRLFVSMAKAGEAGGLLAGVLDRLAGFLEASARLRKKVKSAMMYPVIVICIAFTITTFLIVRVVPIFAEIFADFGAKLPAPTQFLIDLSNFVRGEWYFLILGIGGVIFGVRTFVRSKRGKQLTDRSICAHICAAHSQRCAHPGSARHRRWLLWQSRDRGEYSLRRYRCGKRRQSFDRAFEEEDFSGYAGAHGRSWRSHR
jgi:type IV pilus assembly protein PilC